MKRFLSILLAVLMLMPLFVFSTTAAEQTECTYVRNNIVHKATGSDTGASGQVNHTLVFDGNRETGSFGDHNKKDFSYILEYEEDHLFDEIIVVVNGKGSCPSSWTSIDEVTNYNFTFEIKMLNKAGQTVYATDPENPLSSLDRTAYSTTEDETWEPVSASKIEVKVYSQYKGGESIVWEIEAYSGSSGKHAWTLTDTVESTCEKKGYNEYTCPCGETKQEELPLTVDHKWDAGVVTTPAGDATDGVKTYTCTVCGEEREDTIPATVHTEFDALVTNPTCTEMGYTTYTCTHCGTYTYKGNYVNALGHDMDDGVMTVKPTFTTKGKMTYTCERYDDCGYSYDEELPEAWYRDNELRITTNHATLTEEFTGTTDPFNDVSSKDAIFDGIIMTSPWGSNSNNYWKAPCSSESQMSGKLIIDFDFEYYVTLVNFHIYGNTLGFTIKFYNADDDVIYEVEKSSYAVESAADSPILVSSEIMGQKTKKIVIESTNQNGKSPWVSEVEILAHECLYDESDKTNVNFDAPTCKQTFDGTCWMCKEARVGVVNYIHTYSQLNGVDQITVDTEASCFENGVGRKTCTVCEAEETVVIPATGNHEFDKGAEVIVTKNNCGTAGEAYKKCPTTGCTAVSESYVLPATGNHKNFTYKDLEGHEADYTHEGLQGYICGICGYQDETKEEKVSPTKQITGAITTKVGWWTIRYTDFTSARATFKIEENKITQALGDEYTVKIFGVVKKGEQTKEIQVYGDGKTGKTLADGTFSLVVKDASYTDEFEFSVKVQITCVADGSTASYTVDAKPLSGSDKTISAYDVASYYLANDSRASTLDAEVKKFYEKILASK